jgi:hypothetical protein
MQYILVIDIAAEWARLQCMGGWQQDGMGSFFLL